MNSGHQAEAGSPKPPSSFPKRTLQKRQRKQKNDAEELASILQDISLVKEKQTAETEQSKAMRNRGKPRGRQKKKAVEVSASYQEKKQHSTAKSGPHKKKMMVEDDSVDSEVEIIEEQVVVGVEQFSLQSKVPEIDESDSEDTTENDQHDIRDYILGMTSGGNSFLGINLSSGQDSLSGGPDGGGPEFEPLELPRPPRRRKGAYGQAPVVSDDELNEKIQASWKKDRMAKAARRKEREALRHQGLLQAKKEDMLDELFDIRPNYPAGGMSLMDLKRELENFCLSLPNMHLALPPVNPAARKAIHNILHKLNLKSRSHGKDTERYIIASKPSVGVPEWNEKMFDRLATTLRVRYHLNGRPGVKDTQKYDWEDVGFEAETSWNTPAVMKATTGTIKAKAWMQKMGWSEGQGLGSSENKGIIDPIQIFKRANRGGLGWDS